MNENLDIYVFVLRERFYVFESWKMAWVTFERLTMMKRGAERITDWEIHSVGASAWFAPVHSPDQDEQAFLGWIKKTKLIPATGEGE